MEVETDLKKFQFSLWKEASKFGNFVAQMKSLGTPQRSCFIVKHIPDETKGSGDAQMGERAR